MNEFEKFNESERRKKSNEGRESREGGAEKKAEEAEKKMAARERVEAVGKEVKNTKQQIQNIVANMAQVVKAVAAIRAQLQIAQSDDNIPSVQRDKKALEGLRKRLDNLFGEIKDLKGALLAEEKKSIQQETGNWVEGDVEAEAQRRVEAILEKLELVEK